MKRFQFVRDGVEALDYVQGLGQFANRALHPYPSFLILDLKMPRLDGLEVLHWLQEHRDNCVIRAVICSSSAEPAEIAKAYANGAHTYFRKHLDVNETARMVALMSHYWGEAELPVRHNQQALAMA